MKSETIYHIYNHANGSENLFREEDNYRYFLQQYKTYIHPVANTFAYCLLPNHFHFLLAIKEEDELKNLGGFQNLQGLIEPEDTIENAIQKKISKSFSNFYNSYAKAFNKKYDRRGSLFFQNFRQKPIESIAQWQETFLYIHLNPVKHGFTSDAGQWTWSSWKAYVHPEKTSLVCRTAALDYFDNYENIRYCIESKKESILSLETLEVFKTSKV